jgi:hypothetical protein
MESIEYSLELFGGLVLLIGFGCLIGHLLKLNKFSEEWENGKNCHPGNTDVVLKESGN